MAEKGYVTEIKGNLAVIKMKRTEACAKCRACIAGMTEKEMIMEAENNCGAEVGDWVEGGGSSWRGSSTPRRSLI